MEDLFIETIGNIISKYVDYADRNEVPYLFDPSEKISGNNLLDGYTGEDFSDFINELVNHSELLNEKGTGNETWREILGNEFPAEKQTSSNSNYLLCKNLSYRKKPIWPMSHGGAAFVTLTVVNQQGQIVEYHNNGGPLDKGYDLYFKACTGVKKPYTVYWQITNTGEEARADNCLRGNFELSDMGRYGKRESTAYTGSHSVQCYIIKDNVCVAKSHDYIINIA
ncbi:hypothetical protein [Butyrivibrio sp. INlla16]|uniref:nucleotide-binding domain-containing protein n=1 Tax=Butyrivibrio sp. INlla16 TaxID=1520807 RepID=UPI00088B8476|nr:hypothetical protein [Butyrivibrio sp. INlla16]SDB68105.1 hypothetical protein SAMN02910263_04095 [Butyrivibrio sp. INlla16]